MIPLLGMNGTLGINRFRETCFVTLYKCSGWRVMSIWSLCYDQREEIELWSLLKNDKGGAGGVIYMFLSFLSEMSAELHRTAENLIL